MFISFLSEKTNKNALYALGRTKVPIERVHLEQRSSFSALPLCYYRKSTCVLGVVVSEVPVCVRARKSSQSNSIAELN